jgi:cyclopropane-fatty-acyl-phospholipid synthase
MTARAPLNAGESRMESIDLTTSPPTSRGLADYDSATTPHDRRTTGTPMAAPPEQPGPKVTPFDRWLVRRLLTTSGCTNVSIRLWNGEVVAVEDRPAKLTVSLADRKTLWKLVYDPGFQFGEAYSEGRLRIEGGTIVELLRELGAAINREIDAEDRRSRGWRPFRKHPQRNSLAASKQNIHHHYDIGNEFYRLWLDEQLLYTCAYFEDPGMSLEQAQIAKMDHVCRKMWLRRGDAVIEAGCGWGAFALHMARHYGATVRAFNISHEQIVYARDRARCEGLADRVEFIEDDWRNITGQSDVFVSIGMLEHVGPENYPQLGRVIRKSLKADGRGLIHSIGQNQPRPFDRWIERRIFPGAYPPTLDEMMDLFQTNALSVLDVENIRLHYAETLWHWLDRFERSRERVAEMFDERFVRMWRLYLAGSFAAFEADRLQLYQVLFSPERATAIPRNRRYQYGCDHEPLRFPGLIGEEN